MISQTQPIAKTSTPNTPNALTGRILMSFRNLIAFAGLLFVLLLSACAAPGQQVSISPTQAFSETLSNQPMAANTTFTIKKERLSKKERSNSKAKERHDLWMRHSSSHTKRHQALQQNH